MTNHFDPMDVLGGAAPTRRIPPAPPPEKPPTADRPRETAGPFICTACNGRTVGRKYIPGSLALEVIAWLLFLPLGIFYSWRRRGKEHRKCTRCGGRDLVRA